MATPFMQLTPKQRYQKTCDALWQDREGNGWDAHWKEIAMFLNPRAGLFNGDKPNNGKPKHHNIYDSTGLRARRVLTAGMMSGHSSPARPFHRLKVPDEKLMKSQKVKVWLDQVTRMQREIWSKSNTYPMLQKIYREVGSFGTAANFMEDDFENVIHHTTQTVGEYAFGRNERGKIDTIVRKLNMRLRDVVKKFGLENLSIATRQAWENGNYYEWVKVNHIVQPREDRDQTKRDARNMRWESCWWEPGNDFENKMLRVSGYKRWPCLTPRWDTSSGDTYGESPAMEVLGDCKQLMHEQMRKAQGIDYMTDPPVQVPTTYKENQSSMFPGGKMFYDPAAGGAAPIKNAREVNLNLQYLLEDIVDIRQRIDQGFFVDLFMMMSNIERSNVTAREIAEKQEEKLIMLGPVIANLDDEVLVPLIDFTFDRMVETNIIPTPPPELNGMPLQVEFIGVLSQAQRAVGIGSVDRLIGTIYSIAQAKPEALDKLNVDAIIDDYADMLNVNPEYIVANEEVAIVRAQRAQAAQQQQQMAAMQPMADAAKTASETNVTQPSALTNLMGYSTLQ